MTILLTGGTGKTGSRLARLLHRANQPVLLASRSGVAPYPFEGVQFNWLDPSTYERPFLNHKIDRVYLVAPSVSNMIPIMKSFIDFGIRRGAKRFVLLSATTLMKGGPGMGGVHEYLDSLKIDYCVLRPTYFMESLYDEPAFLKSIRNDNAVYSATEDGLIPWISADDIAAAAFDALVDKQSHNTDHIVIGPELHSYDSVAALLSEVLQRQIVHHKLSVAEMKQRWLEQGASEGTATLLTKMDEGISKGTEERHFYVTEKITGKRTLREILGENRKLWT